MPGLVAARDAAAFLASPIGAYITGASFAIWAESPERIGMFHIGAFDRADEPAITQLFPIVVHPALAAHYDVIHDISGVSTFDQPAFEFFVAFLRQWVRELVPRIRRVAVVKPTGVAGAAFTGLFHEWVVPNFNSQLCATRDEAYAFLAVPDDARDAIEEMGAATAGEPALRRMRALLEADLREASLMSVADAMSTSTRTLQRMLTACHTTFRRELLAARLRVAQSLLLARDEKVEVIADELGFASSGAFSTMFRKAFGETPSEFRERFRK
jgi:AraC-like DNA-binding protein